MIKTMHISSAASLVSGTVPGMVGVCNNLFNVRFTLGFPDGTSGKEAACQCRTCKRCGLIPGSGRSLGEGLGKPTSVFLPGESHGQRSLAGYSP